MNFKYRRPGFYVEERHFGNSEAQALAFAQYRAEIFGRSVTVKHLRSSLDKMPDWFATVDPDRVAA